MGDFSLTMFDALSKKRTITPERFNSEPGGLSSATPKALIDEMSGEAPFQAGFTTLQRRVAYAAKPDWS